MADKKKMSFAEKMGQRILALTGTSADKLVNKMPANAAAALRRKKRKLELRAAGMNEDEATRREEIDERVFQARQKK